MHKLIVSVVTAGALASASSVPAAQERVATGLDYETDGTETHVTTNEPLRNLRFCEIFFIKVKDEVNELHVYNPTGLNDMASTHDSCPDGRVNEIDFEAVKQHYGLDAIYYNKPRYWIGDRLEVPVGTIRRIGELDWYWMAASHMPASVKMAPGFLTYKKAPVERKTELTFSAGKPVFLLDDPDGKVWVMKSWRDAHGQTYEGLKDLGSRYQSLPEGYRFRVKVLDKDLVLRPTEGTATVMQDEFENTFDYLGDGSSNYVP